MSNEAEQGNPTAAAPPRVATDRRSLFKAAGAVTGVVAGAVAGKFSLAPVSSAAAQDSMHQPWWPSRWGADDEAGSTNHITPAKVLEAAKLIRDGTIYKLGRDYEPGIPFFGAREPFGGGLAARGVHAHVQRPVLCEAEAAPGEDHGRRQSSGTCADDDNVSIFHVVLVSVPGGGFPAGERATGSVSRSFHFENLDEAAQDCFRCGRTSRDENVGFSHPLESTQNAGTSRKNPAVAGTRPHGHHQSRHAHPVEDFADGLGHRFRRRASNQENIGHLGRRSQRDAEPRGIVNRIEQGATLSEAPVAVAGVNHPK